MVSCQEVCRLSTLVSDVWIEVTAGKDFVDFWDFLNKLSYTHALWPHNEIFLTQQKIAWRTQKASVKEDMPGVLSRRWYIFVPGRWQPTIFRVFQKNLPQNTANQLFDHPASGIWYFFARALGTIDVTLTTLDDHFYFHLARRQRPSKSSHCFSSSLFSSAHFISFLVIRLLLDLGLRMPQQK